MNVGLLKKLIENIPDEFEVCFSEKVNPAESLEIQLYNNKIVLK